MRKTMYTSGPRSKARPEAVFRPRPEAALRSGRRTGPACMPKAVAAGALAVAALLPGSVDVTAAAAAAPPRLGECAAGELCLWEKGDFKGARQTHELSGISIDSCTPLPRGATVESLANRTGRPVTTYQSEECAETGEFETYPGGGTWLPRSPYRVRAFKVWEH